MNPLLDKIAFSGQLGRNLVENITARPYDRLLLWSDAVGWSLDEDAIALETICARLGYKARRGHGFRRRHAAIHYLSQFALSEPDIYLGDTTNRYGIAYYHGGPDDAGFEALFASLVRVRDRLSKVHISHRRMERDLLGAGFAPEQIALIPIGLPMENFPLQSDASKHIARASLGIPQDAFVVGSFQKDGDGWGEGLEPKLIKGPDIFVEVMGRLKEKIPHLHVLLSGPSRGFVKKGLAANGISFTHRFLTRASDVAQLYQALDLYLLTSRVEGGPKAILESMASGVPLVATNVGQGPDIMRHGENAYVAEPEATDALYEGALTAFGDPDYFAAMVAAGRATAAQHDYHNQDTLWRDQFLSGFTEKS